MIAVGYGRVSTTRQANEGESLQAQRRSIEQYAEALGYELVAHYEDAGRSGADRNRPGLEKALDELERDGGALIVYSLSRLSRSIQHTLEVAERLERAGADLISLSERIDTTTAAGRMVFRVLASMAAFERERLSERTRDALAYRREAGRVYGPVPFGYRRDGDRLAPVPEDLRTVRRIRSERMAGRSYRGIARRLNAEGIPSPRGKTWSGPGVKIITENVIYEGMEDAIPQPGRGSQTA